MLTVPGALDSLPLVHDFVAAAALSFDIPPADAYCFQLAAEEACTNIVRHGWNGTPPADSPIDLELAADASGWTLSICDSGRPFDPAALPPPDLTSDLAKRQPGGLGVHLIRSVMDQVRYCSTGGRNCLTLVRQRSFL